MSSSSMYNDSQFKYKLTLTVKECDKELNRSIGVGILTHKPQVVLNNYTICQNPTKMQLTLK